MRVAISFHSPPLWYVRRVGIFCLIVGLAAAATISSLGGIVYSDMYRWNISLQALKEQSTVRVSAVDDSSPGEIKTELQAANQIIEKLNTPWAALFASLEGVYSDNAILLGIEPDPVSRSIRLTAESKDPGSMLEFVRQLRAAKIFADAYVVNHSVNQNDAQRPVRFSVASHWLDVVPEAAIDKLLVEAEKDLNAPTHADQKLVKSEGGPS